MVLNGLPETDYNLIKRQRMFPGDPQASVTHAGLCVASVFERVDTCAHTCCTFL